MVSRHLSLRLPAILSPWLLAAAFACASPELETSQAAAPCTTSADCPIGAKYCAPDEQGQLSCQARLDTGYGACGVRATADGVGGPCDASCGTCAAATELGAEFCTRGCATDADCGPNAFCAAVDEQGPVCVPFHCACSAKSILAQLLGDALAPAGRDVCDLGQSFGDLERIYPDSIAHDPLRPTAFQRLYHAPAAIPGFQRRLAGELDAAAQAGRALSGTLRVAARAWDEEPGAPDPSLAAGTFEEEVGKLFGSDAPDARPGIEAEALSLPAQVKARLAPVIAALGRAKELRDAAIPEGADRARLARAPMAMFWYMREVVGHGDKIDLSRPRDRALFLEDFRYAALAKAALIIAKAVEDAELDQLDASGSYSFNLLTPAGRIVIGDTANHHYSPSDDQLDGELALVVDFGGDDRYEVPVGGTNDPDKGIAVAVDVAGADVYTYPKNPGVGDANRRPVSDAAGRRPSVPHHSLSEVRRQGAGALGVGMLVDLGSEGDVYESLRFSQGFGALGVGALYDAGGDDTYLAEAGVQGAGQFGLGVLIDRGGDDAYTAYSLSQGAVHVKAVGMLVDHGGSDDYWTSPGNSYIGPSGRLSGHDYLYEYGVNQGASWGRRGDHPQDFVANDNHSSGGVAALIDRGDGSDRYTCGAFCQGMGYWFGTGLLDDEGGNDVYEGRVFAGGAGIHFGVGALHDGAGDDRYHEESACVHTTLGLGDDLSLGWLQDDGGNDRYHGCRSSFGSGTEKGTGVFADLGGDDAYRADRVGAFGWAQDPSGWHDPAHVRFGLKTAGVFGDGGGVDQYERPGYFSPEPIGDGRSWLHPWMTAPLPSSVDLSAPVSYGDAPVFAAGLDSGTSP